MEHSLPLSPQTPPTTKHQEVHTFKYHCLQYSVKHKGDSPLHPLFPSLQDVCPPSRPVPAHSSTQVVHCTMCTPTYVVLTVYTLHCLCSIYQAILLDHPTTPGDNSAPCTSSLPFPSILSIPLLSASFPPTSTSHSPSLLCPLSSLTSLYFPWPSHFSSPLLCLPLHPSSSSNGT